MQNSRTFTTQQSGVTLIELLITVTVLSVILAIAIPNYRDRVRKANRTEATTALMAIAAAQEKFYVKNNSYTADMDEMKVGALKHFTVEMTVTDAGGFEAVATPKVADTECSSFTIDQTGNKTYTGDIAETIGCW